MAASQGIGAFAPLAFFVLGLAASGCTTYHTVPSQLTRVESQLQAGVTDVAVIYVEPWDAVAQSLVPNFDISADAALRQVIPATSGEVSRFLDAVSGYLGLGLPGTTFQHKKIETEKSDEVAASQTTTTHKTVSGSAPDVPSESPAGERTAKSLPGTDTLGKDLSQEPLLKYKAALALYQEVKMLNRYVQGAARGSNYTPYLVRLQVALMPYARNLPYDSYTSISFFTSTPRPGGAHPQPGITGLPASDRSSPASNRGVKQRIPIVIPLVVTDALEGSLSSTTSEALRQIAFGLSGVISNVGLKADSQAFQDALRSISGVALNSLQTVSRLGENGLRVRLGAVKSPISADAFVMVPRTHNVTLLLLVPNEVVAGAKEAPTIEMATRSYFHDANHGTRLPTFDASNSLIRELAEAASLYIGKLPDKPFSAPAGCPRRQYGGTPGSEPQYGKDDLLRYLIEQTQHGDISCFSQALEQHAGIQDANFLWNELSTLANSYGFAGTSFQLPKPLHRLPPPSQTVLLSDDGKASGAALLRGGASLVPERLLSSLAIKDGQAKVVYEIPAISIAASASGLRLIFPSLMPFGLIEKGTLKNGLGAELRLWQRADGWNWSDGDFDFLPCATHTSTNCASYPVVVQQIPTPPKATFQFDTAVGTVPIKADNTTQLSTYTTFIAPTQIRVTVSGAELRAANLPDSKGQPGQPIPVDGGVLLLSPPAKAGARLEVILSLGNVMDGSTVKISATAFGGKDAAPSETVVASVSVKK